MKYDSYKSTLTVEEYRDAKNLADLINDIDNGIRVDPVEKERLYAKGDKILRAAVVMNQERLKKRRWKYG